jgi:hypothetical protein
VIGAGPRRSSGVGCLASLVGELPVGLDLVEPEFVRLDQFGVLDLGRVQPRAAPAPVLDGERTVRQQRVELEPVDRIEDRDRLIQVAGAERGRERIAADLLDLRALERQLTARGAVGEVRADAQAKDPDVEA